MILKGRTRHLVEAYIKQWRELLGKAGPDLVAFLDHIKKRVLLDMDPPDVRQGMCLVAVMACNDLVSAAKKLARGHDVTQYVQMAELFDQIAEGPEVTVELEDEHGGQRITTFKDGARTGMTPAARPLRREDVIWSFTIGPDSSFVKDPPVGYVQIAAAEGLEWFELSSGPAAASGAIVERWVEIFERVAWRVLFSHHDPVWLRRAYASFAQMLLVSLDDVLERHAHPAPITPDVSECLSEIFGQIVEGGSLECAAHLRDGAPVFVSKFDQKGRTASFSTEYANVEQMPLVSALRALSAADVEFPAAPAQAPAKPRAKPRPNEPCSCGSGRKYKKCCAAH